MRLASPKEWNPRALALPEWMEALRPNQSQEAVITLPSTEGNTTRRVLSVWTRPDIALGAPKETVLQSQRSKFTVPALLASKGSGRPVSMVTAYDALFAALVDDAGVDIILVGDSLGTVLQAKRNTLSVTMDQMAYHVSMVADARPKAMVVGDMPFGSYHTCHRDAIANAVTLVQHGAEVVKMEGGIHVADTVAAIVECDIPVMGHIGLTPQSYHRMGGNRIQGRSSGDTAGSKERLVRDAKSLVEAGACAIVIEGVPQQLAGEITRSVPVPTIGIGAGRDCDGQVLVLHDLLGLSPRKLTFAKQYRDLGDQARDAVREYVADVRAGTWPDDEHSFH